MNHHCHQDGYVYEGGYDEMEMEMDMVYMVVVMVDMKVVMKDM